MCSTGSESLENFAEKVPGIMFSMVIAFFGFAVWTAYKPISSLMWSFVFGIVVSNLTTVPERLEPGLKFCSSQLLKFTIAVLGLVTSASVWFEVGLGAVNAIVIILFSFFMSLILGRRLGLSTRLAILIGVGTSICGASAIAAVAPAIEAKEEEIGIAIGGITLFGLISMFLYPYLFSNTVVNQWLLSNPTVYAIWVGSGVHESAQVIVAACTLSLDCLQPALIIKSIRIFMIAPIVLASIFFLNRFDSEQRSLKGKATVPLFAVAFLVNSVICAVLNAYAGSVPMLGAGWEFLKLALRSSLIPFLLAIAFAGVGSKVKFKDIAKVGWKPFGFAAIMAVGAGALALGMAIVIAPYIT
ncbi:MAG: putative sulfate exporter family transporter [Candidatus Bathyarchaeota archaeon]|nr:putative sulfate exporter family transporter [Candidatus Bathyarchaeota archaeon]